MTAASHSLIYNASNSVLICAENNPISRPDPLQASRGSRGQIVQQVDKSQQYNCTVNTVSKMVIRTR